MKKMIEDYKSCDAALTARITNLRKRLKSDKLRTKERQALEARINLLSEERTEIRHDIREMMAHRKVGGAV